MLNQHYTLEYARSVRISQLSALLIKAFQKEDERDLWDLYLIQLPHMEKKISFEEFKNRAKKTSQNKEYKEKQEEQISTAKKIADKYRSKNKAQN